MADSPKYKEVDVLRDPEGIIIVISQRLHAGPPHFNLGIYKEFERNGEKTRSLYWGPELANAVLRTVPLACERVEKLKAAAIAEMQKASSNGTNGRRVRT